jgi:hypothetical protein
MFLVKKTMFCPHKKNVFSSEKRPLDLGEKIIDSCNLYYNIYKRTKYRKDKWQIYENTEIDKYKRNNITIQIQKTSHKYTKNFIVK